MSIAESTTQYYIGQEEEQEQDNFPDKRGGKYEGVYFFRGESGDLIYTGTDGEEWRQFKQDWKDQKQEESEEDNNDVEEPVEEEEEVEEPVNEEPVEENFEDTTIYSPSNAGTPLENPDLPGGYIEDGDDLEKLDFSSKYSNPNGSGNDRYTGTGGANTYEFNPLLNGTQEAIDKHLFPDGSIDWKGVAVENDSRHDHWVESLGEDTIMDFSGQGGEGDKIDITGHTVTAMVIEESDSMVKIGVYSDQAADSMRGYGAHDFDVLGTITVNHDGNFNYGSDVSVNPKNFDGVREFA